MWRPVVTFVVFSVAIYVVGVVWDGRIAESPVLSVGGGQSQLRAAGVAPIAPPLAIQSTATATPGLFSSAGISVPATATVPRAQVATAVPALTLTVQLPRPTPAP